MDLWGLLQSLSVFSFIYAGLLAALFVGLLVLVARRRAGDRAENPIQTQGSRKSAAVILAITCLLVLTLSFGVSVLLATKPLVLMMLERPTGGQELAAFSDDARGEPYYGRYEMVNQPGGSTQVRSVPSVLDQYAALAWLIINVVVGLGGVFYASILWRRGRTSNKEPEYSAKPG